MGSRENRSQDYAGEHGMIDQIPPMKMLAASEAWSTLICIGMMDMIASYRSPTHTVDRELPSHHRISYGEISTTGPVYTFLAYT